MKNFDSANRPAQAPEPVYDANPGFLELYHKAWELADKHVKHIPGMPQDPYMDEAFCLTQIWIWDTCFMSLYCKYAFDAFPGVETLNNFYSVMYGNGHLPTVAIPPEEPGWTGFKPGDKAPLHIHISDNPPLFAWAEYQNARYTGDTEHLRKLLLEDRYLQKHYEWLENLTSPFHPEWASNATCWIAHKNGYSWEGGRSGMDNTPRGRSGAKSDQERPATPDTLWLDALAQQALSAWCISEMLRLIDAVPEAELWYQKYRAKADLLRNSYWCEEDGIFYDLSLSTGKFCKVPTIASFWPLTCGAASREQAKIIADKLDDPDYFGGEYPFLTLAAKDPDFVADGGKYWRGSVWLPTAYAALRGLVGYGFHDIARRNAVKLLNHMLNTYREVEPHTIWECYAPRAAKPADTTDFQRVRKDFCGWSALGPISIFIENVIGIYDADAFRRIVRWAPDLSLKGKSGIRNLRFGDVTASMILENKRVSVDSDAPFTLEIDGVPHALAAGHTIIDLD